jgi:hypothetical protein
VVKKLAEEAGIDLGLQPRGGAESPIRAPERLQKARKGPAPSQDTEEPALSMEEAKRGFKELVQRLAAEKG